MKKLLLVALVVLFVPASAMAGMTAFMDMDELTNSELASQSAQAGISIAIDLGISNTSGSYVAWSDGNGYTGYTAGGSVTLRNLGLSGTTYTMANPLTVDVCTDPVTGSWIVLGVGALNLDMTADLEVGATVNTGLAADQLGSITNHIILNGGTIKIKGHSF